MQSPESGRSAPWHGTTILTVRKGGVVAVGGDGQVSIGQTIVKANAKKVRRLGKGDVIGGFAGATADAFTLFERLESAKKNGNCSLSDGMRRLCQERKLKAFDVGDGRWQDVDTPEAFTYTESIFERDFLESPILQRFANV